MSLNKWIALGVLLILGVMAFMLFWPRHYEVPEAKVRAGTQYWDLPTGSKIAYIHSKANKTPQPYPIIYLHGGPGGFISDQQINFFSQLSDDGYEVYLYDQVGSGNSERLENIGEYTATRHLADLEAIVEKIGSERVILIGQSWGGILAALFAAEHPEKMERLILLCPGPLAPFNRKVFKLSAPDSLNLKDPSHSNRQANKKMRTWRSAAMRFFALNFLNKLATDKEADAYQTHLNFELQRSTVLDSTKLPPITPGGGYYAQQMTMASINYVKDPRKSLPDSTTPTLLLKAQYDNQPWGATQEYLELFKNHRFVLVEDAGHALYLDQPERRIGVIKNFLTSKKTLL